MEIDLNKQGFYQHLLKKGLTSGAKWIRKNSFKWINRTDLYSVGMCFFCSFGLLNVGLVTYLGVGVKSFHIASLFRPLRRKYSLCNLIPSCSLLHRHCLLGQLLAQVPVCRHRASDWTVTGVSALLQYLKLCSLWPGQQYCLCQHVILFCPKVMVFDQWSRDYF